MFVPCIVGRKLCGLVACKQFRSGHEEEPRRNPTTQKSGDSSARQELFMTSISSGSYQNTYQTNLQKQLFNRIDTNSDGKVTKDEFTSGHPKDVSESQASALFDKLDKKKTGSLSESDLANTGPPPNIGGLDTNTLASLLQGQQQDQSSDNGGQDDHFSDLFAKIDSDGSGSVSKKEFVSSRPKGVSEDQASSLYDKIDSTGSDALTADQLKTGLEANSPVGGSPPPSKTESSNSSSNIQSLIDALQSVNDDEKGNTNANSTVKSATTTIDNFLKALKSYSSTADYTSNLDATSLLASA